MAASAAHQRSRQLAEQAGSVLAADGFRDWFLPTFARWLQANFRNHEHVAHDFGVRNQTALNWWNGDHRASGDTVALVFITFPAAVGWFLAEWEGRS